MPDMSNINSIIAKALGGLSADAEFYQERARVEEGLSAARHRLDGLRIEAETLRQDITANPLICADLETLLSETEIKLFLPGQRSPKTLELIKKLLGEQSVISASIGSRDQEQRLSEQLSESPRPLMTEDEIRRSAQALLIVRRHPAALIEPVPYAAIHPWRKQAAINPFHGKPFLRPVALRLQEPKS